MKKYIFILPMLLFVLVSCEVPVNDNNNTLESGAVDSGLVIDNELDPGSSSITLPISNNNIAVTITDNYIKEPVSSPEEYESGNFEDLQVPEGFNFSVFQPYKFEIKVFIKDSEGNLAPYNYVGLNIITNGVTVTTITIDGIYSFDHEISYSDISITLSKAELKNGLDEVVYMDGPEFPSNFTAVLGHEELENEILTVIINE